MERVREQIGLNRIAEKKDRDIVVAVLDTGVVKHPDLKDRILYFKDFVNQSPEEYDDNSHGTHICGILCGDGRLSEGRFKGVAPNVRLVVCKVLDRHGDGQAEIMLRALEFIRRYRKQLNIRILNVSVGIGDLKDKEITNKLQRAMEALWEEGILVVCAAGNKGPAENSISSVGGSSKVITVGCHDGNYFKEERNRCELHSGRGKKTGAERKPDIVAPGTRIVSCNHIWNAYSKDWRASYMEKSGTSMATPIVSGCAAILMSREPYLLPGQVKERILYSAKDLGEPWNKQGWGMIDVERMLQIF